MLDIIIKYWVQWICALIAAGIAVFAKHYVNLQKKDLERKWLERENKAKNEVIDKLEKEVEEEAKKSTAADVKLSAEIESVSLSVENLEAGLLSLLGKQFREECIYLLESDHVITVQEYEEFEEDYYAYKGLGGNHRGDTLHDRVVEKFNKQL